MPETSNCGNPECRSSTSMGGGLTFGRGELDGNGYFEFPCRICSKAWTDALPETKRRVIQRMINEGMTIGEANEYVSSEEWLNIPSWPYV